ncbi:unnamed protein product, partial [Chrysoparadoxa australica]
MSVLLAALAAAAQSSSPAISVTDFVGEIRIVQGATLSATVERQGAAPIVEISESANALRIDGGQDIRRWRCYGRNEENRRVGRNRGDALRFDEWPLLTITTPNPADFSIEDSVFRGEAGDLASLDLGASKCGSFEGGAVAGDANVGLSGSADVTIGDVGGEAAVAISGSGDVALGSAASLSIAVSGSGDVSAHDIAGELTVSLSGSGDVEAGNVEAFTGRSSGSGDIEIGNAPG